MRKNSLYIIKHIDPKYFNITGNYSYQFKDCYENLGKFNIFRKEECFKSKNEAKRHIQKYLHMKDHAGGRIRPDVNYSYFEIIQVYPCKICNKYYTTDKNSVL